MNNVSYFTTLAAFILSSSSWAMSSDYIRGLQWQSMSDDSTEMAQVMLAAADKIAAQVNPAELHFNKVERSTTPEREFYRLYGMRVVGGDMVFGNFTLVIVKSVVREHRRTYYRYEAYYDGGGNNDNLRLLPPHLVRS